MKNIKRYLSAFLCALMLIAATGCTASQTESPVSTESQTSSKQAEQSTTLRFYLVRHGQTYTNIKEMSIASAGSAPLTEKGRSYAYYAGMGLAAQDVSFLAAYCSPLNRTYETAQFILAGLGVDMPITVEENVRDVNWGVMEAAYPEEYIETYGHENDDYLYFLGGANDADYVAVAEGTETTYEFNQRFEEGLRNIASQHQGESGNILVAAHL